MRGAVCADPDALHELASRQRAFAEETAQALAVLRVRLADLGAVWDDAKGVAACAAIEDVLRRVGRGAEQVEELASWLDRMAGHLDDFLHDGGVRDPIAGFQVGRILIDRAGNAIPEPAGGGTFAREVAGRGSLHTTYANGSNAYRVDYDGHGGDPTSHGHVHRPGVGPGPDRQGASLNVHGEEVPGNSRGAHLPIKPLPVEPSILRSSQGKPLTVFDVGQYTATGIDWGGPDFVQGFDGADGHWSVGDEYVAVARLLPEVMRKVNASEAIPADPTSPERRCYEAFFGCDPIRIDWRLDGRPDVLDGRHRLYACMKLGISPPVSLAERKRG